MDRPHQDKSFDVWFVSTVFTHLFTVSQLRRDVLLDGTRYCFIFIFEMYSFFFETYINISKTNPLHGFPACYTREINPACRSGHDQHTVRQKRKQHRNENAFLGKNIVSFRINDIPEKLEEQIILYYYFKSKVGRGFFFFLSTLVRKYIQSFLGWENPFVDELLCCLVFIPYTSTTCHYVMW